MAGMADVLAKTAGKSSGVSSVRFFFDLIFQRIRLLNTQKFDVVSYHILSLLQAFRSKAAGRGQQIILAGEVNDTLKRIQETKNVIGTMVINHDGIPIKSSIDTTLTSQV